MTTTCLPESRISQGEFRTGAVLALRGIASWRGKIRMPVMKRAEGSRSFLTHTNGGPMRAPQRKRPQRRSIEPPPEGIDVSGLASRVTYVGSPEHKTAPSFAGQPRPRGDATKCDTALSDRLGDIQRWLRHAVEVQCFGGPWEGGFPRYVWCKVGEIVFEARLVNRGFGQYKGWQLEPDEWAG